MTKEKAEMIAALTSDETFGKELETVEDIQGFISAFAAHDVYLTEDEAWELCEAINTKLPDTEMTETDLEKVAGGAAVLTMIIVGGVVIGVCYVVGKVVGKVIKNKLGICM